MKEWENRLRVAMFTNVYLPTTNGVVVSVETFRRALTELGHHVYVFGPNSGDIEDRAPYIFRYPAVELPLQKYPLTLPVSPYIDHVLRNLKPQILHANHPALLGRVAEKKSLELNLPLVFTYHTRYADYSHYADPLPQENVKEFIDHWLASFMTACHQVIVPSESIKSMLKATYGDSVAHHVSVVPTGVETEKFAKLSQAEARQKLGWPEDRKVLVSMGRLAKEKNFDLLIKAFSRLEGDETVLKIIGSGDERKNLEALVTELGLGDRVKFTGLVPFDDVPTHLAASDLFVFASVTETQGLVTLEAMASGLPVAAVDASGTREAVSADCSRLAQTDPDSLAAAMKEMLQASDQQALRAAARERAKLFDVLIQGEAMIEAYRRAQQAHAAKSKVLILTEEHKSRWEELLDFLRV